MAQREGKAETVLTKNVLAPSYQLVTNVPEAIPVYRRALDVTASRFAELFGDAPPLVVIAVMDTIARREVRLLVEPSTARNMVFVFDSPTTTLAWWLLRRRTHAAGALVAEHAAHMWIREHAESRAGGAEVLLPDWLAGALALQLSDLSAEARAAALVRDRRSPMPSIATVLLASDDVEWEPGETAPEHSLFIAFLLEHSGPAGVRALVDRYTFGRRVAVGDTGAERTADDQELDAAWRAWYRKRGLN